MGKNEKSTLNIAMLGHKHVPSREGGIEVVVEELGTRLVQSGHSVTCYNRGGHHVSGQEFDGEKRNEFKGIKLKTVPTVNRKGLAAMTSSVSAAICAAFGKYDIVHFHAEGSCVLLWLPKLFGKRCIVTIHGLDHKRPKWGKAASAYILLGEKTAAKYADEIIVLSKGVQEYFLATYGRDTRLIYNGVSRPKVRNAALITKLFGLENKSYILFLGRLVPEKGLSYLINAFKKVNTPLKLVIAGGASDSDQFVKQMKELARDDKRIIFTGFVRGELLDELYSNAYLYVLPSDLEGMPLSLLEAMSYGNCCVVSDIPECADVVGDRAVTFKRGDTEDLTDRLQMLCDNPEAVKQYQDGSAGYIRGKYNWDSAVDETVRVYERNTAGRAETKKNRNPLKVQNRGLGKI